eukprot:1137053-Pelagomonas_calceolata.AAC.8
MLAIRAWDPKQGTSYIKGTEAAAGHIAFGVAAVECTCTHRHCRPKGRSEALIRTHHTTGPCCWCGNACQGEVARCIEPCTVLTQSAQCVKFGWSPKGYTLT